MKVFSPGGSCVLSSMAMRHLKKISLVMFLDVPLEIIRGRLITQNITNRGIVGLRKMTLNELFEFRKPLYLKYADVVVELGKRPLSDGCGVGPR